MDLTLYTLNLKREHQKRAGEKKITLFIERRRIEKEVKVKIRPYHEL